MEYLGINNYNNRHFSLKKVICSSKKYSLDNTDKRLRIFAKRSVHMDESGGTNIKRVFSDDLRTEPNETETRSKKLKIENVIRFF